MTLFRPGRNEFCGWIEAGAQVGNPHLEANFGASVNVGSMFLVRFRPWDPTTSILWNAVDCMCDGGSFVPRSEASSYL